ncbi:MAG: isocitrate/isopropylmalate dehydrogenase family protein [Anaerolineae bacterium]|nr:isocitrate/isopropylmalate dehydrogenase family protein [Anaerolineae bacterium]
MNRAHALPLRIALIPGDGIGQEVTPAAAAAMQASGVAVEFVELEAGWQTFVRSGSALPAVTVQALATVDGALFGAVSSPAHAAHGYRSPIVQLRQQFDLFANLRPLVSTPTPGSWPGVDLLIVRENTEGMYAGRERLEGDTAIAERVITRRASERIMRVALEQARRRRGLVTLVHKANVLRVTDGLFREASLSVAPDFPDVQVEEGLVDSVAYRLVRQPQHFDVIVTTNLFGDILSDLAAGLTGGLGLAASANQGERFVVAEPVHGSAPDIAGQGIANPLAAIRAGALLLRSLGQADAAARIEHAVNQVLASGPLTPDLGGNATTAEVTQAVVRRLEIGDRRPEICVEGG